MGRIREALQTNRNFSSSQPDTIARAPIQFRGAICEFIQALASDYVHGWERFELPYGITPTGTCHGCRSILSLSILIIGSVAAKSWASFNEATRKTKMPRNSPS